jgi:hypothetical protein
MRRAKRGDRLEPAVKPDAVLHMDDQIPWRQGGGLGQKGLGPMAAAGRAHQPFAQHILLGDHRQPGAANPSSSGQTARYSPPARLGQVARMADRGARNASSAR